MMPGPGLGESLAGVQGQTDGEALTEEFVRWCVGEQRFDRHQARFRKCISFLVKLNWRAIAAALCRLWSAALVCYNRRFHGGLALTSTEEPLAPSPPAQPHRSEPLACTIDMPYANNNSQKQSRLSFKCRVRMQLLKQRAAKRFSTRRGGMSSNSQIVAV